VIEGRFLLISSNRGYEVDAFLEAFAVGAERGATMELFGFLGGGRVVARLPDKERIEDGLLLKDLNDHGGRLRYVKKALGCSFVGRTAELDDACGAMNSLMRRRAKSKSAAVKIEGVGFSDPMRMQAISKIMDGIRTVDLRHPQVVAYLRISCGFFIAGVTDMSSVLGVEDR